ncbi:hypothetical protein CLAIMM_06285 [Cladophialophora immunda]|nr:hypothetical protein CLAIMM_06285 [Cladophialophora immunda]
MATFVISIPGNAMVCDHTYLGTDVILLVYSNGLRLTSGLYKGYKRRNAQLDALTASPPAYLAQCGTKLANENFMAVEDEDRLEEIHNHLFKIHFYAQTMDYGHAKYLNTLITQKLTVQKALVRLTQRLAEVLYQQRKWFKWARECQEEEEKQRENEQKKIKHEAALFRRQAKRLEARIRELRAKEDSRRQEEYLESVYQESLANQSAESDDEAWDPIEDIMENERGTYIELIKHFLWLELRPSSNPPSESSLAPEVDVDGACEPSTKVKDIQTAQNSSNESSVSQNVKAKKKSKSKKNKGNLTTDDTTEIEYIDPDSSNGASHSRTVIVPAQGGSKRQETEPDGAKIESREDIRMRLLEGTKPINDNLMFLDASGRTEKFERMEPMPASEVDRVLEEIAEIKNYLFCRLLLGNAVLLPAAMKANSVHDLLADPEVKTADLRDLCLRLEQPQLQEIRDACADFCRKVDDNNACPDDELDEDEHSEKEDGMMDLKLRKKRHKHHLPKIWKSNREKAIRTAQPQASVALQEMLDQAGFLDEKHGTRVDFGKIDEQGEFQKSNLRVKICGRYIYHYPYRGAMKRGGWLHFSIMAKECNLHEAVELCKSWDEFFELSVLTLYQYFPSPEWLLWAGDFVKRQYLQVGFFPYFIFNEASGLTASKRGRNQVGRRIHASSEMRNFICAHMKRIDPVTRRFIQYTSMQTTRMLILVRDGKTGRIIVTPPEDDLWLVRSKHGYGRETRTEWETKRYVGPLFFEEMERFRSFSLGFDDYYDIYIWCTEPGTPWQMLHASVIEMLYKANRVIQPEDIFASIAPILKTVTRDENTWRPRDIREGESAQSIWDEIRNDSRFEWRTPKGDVYTEMPKHLAYGEADALEDEILFPEDFSSSSSKQRFKPIENSLTMFESGRMQDFVTKQFIQRGDFSDEESDDMDMEYIEEEDTDETDASQQGGAGEEDQIPSSRDHPVGDELEYLEEYHKDAARPSEHEGDESSRELLSNIFSHVATSRKILDSFGPGPNVEDLDLEEEYLMYIDMYKSKVFKEAWHGCDLEPGARDSWNDYISIRYDAEKDLVLFDEACFLSAQVLKHLEYHPETHPRVMNDVRRACAAVLLFSSKASSFLGGRYGDKHKDSKLLDQKGRSEQLPTRRSCYSSKYRDGSFYKAFDEAVQASRTKVSQTLYDELPAEWDICIRPKLAQLFKHGVICVSYTPEECIPGRAFAAKEHGRPLDLFIDYRPTVNGTRLTKHMVSPYAITIESLRENARQFATSRPEARFALLRLWSTPYFYPFMIALWNRPSHAFTDAIGRAWEWKFMPTDMPYSEHSVHYNMTERFNPFMAKFEHGNRLKIRKDVVLVMGENEEQLLKLASAATFIVQTRPWRLEIDFCKSFVNIDIEFLNGLDDAWWA